MKFKEKGKKNKNCELSHMIRPAESLEVYKQKQNILFIYESVEHRMFKVSWARLWVCLGVCTAECACWAYARMIVLHDSDGRAARLVVVHGLVGTRPRFGRNTRIGCTRAKFYGHDWAMWLIYRNVLMQLKGKGMQLKVSMQKNIGERGSTRAIYIYSLLL